MFGLVVRFELVDKDAAARFDALVARTGEAIREREPGTLLYAVNEVVEAPLSRVFYEVYADREAFEVHEAMPHVREFLAEREQYIAATRVEFLTLVGGKNVPGGAGR